MIWSYRAAWRKLGSVGCFKRGGPSADPVSGPAARPAVSASACPHGNCCHKTTVGATRQVVRIRHETQIYDIVEIPGVHVSGFEITCPKWALPREEIPVHVKINKAVTHKIDCVRIFLDERLKLADTINISEYENGQTITVREIGKSARSDYDYFGIAVATKALPDSLKTQIPIPIDVVYRDGTKDRHFAHARIFRPRVEFARMQEKLVLSDAKGGPAVPISLKFLGFGEIRLRAECKTGGRIISESSPLTGDTLLRAVGEGVSSGADDYVRALYELIHNDGQKAADAARRAVESCLSQIVSEALGRHLGANSRLESPTRMRYSRRAPSPNSAGDSPQEPRAGTAPARPPSAEVRVRFFYKDNMENEYEPIERTISIVDKRAEHAGSEVAIPIRVDVDESEAYENVGGMSIGS